MEILLSVTARENIRKVCRNFCEKVFRKISVSYIHDLEKLKVFSQTSEIHILLIAEEYGEEQIEEIKAGKVYVLSEKEKACVRDGISVFRYQPGRENYGNCFILSG